MGEFVLFCLKIVLGAFCFAVVIVIIGVTVFALGNLILEAIEEFKDKRAAMRRRTYLKERGME